MRLLDSERRGLAMLHKTMGVAQKLHWLAENQYSEIADDAARIIEKINVMLDAQWDMIDDRRLEWANDARSAYDEQED